MASLPLPIQTFFLFLFLSLINTTPSDLTPKTFPSKPIIYQDFSIDSSGAFTVHLYIGTPPIKHLFYIDIELSANVMDETVYTPLPLDYRRMGMILLRGSRYESTVTSDNIYIHSLNTDLKFFEFHLINSHNKPHGLNSLALICFINRDNHSIVHLLKNRGLISDLSFGFIGKDIEKNYERGQVYYGGIPNEITSNQKKGKCNKNTKTIYWGCDITSISFIRNETEVKYEHEDMKAQMVFRSVSNEMIAPKSFITFVYEHVLVDYNSKHMCTYDTELICDCEVESVVSEVVIVLGEDVKFIFKGEEMFEEVEDKCKFVFREGEEKVWVFGTWFMTKFAMNFDLENKVIEFYGENVYVDDIESDVEGYIGWERDKVVKRKVIGMFGWMMVVAVLVLSVMKIKLKGGLI